MRLALLGAFPYPAPQGSQLFAGEQARALRVAGAEVTLLCYGRGRGPARPEIPLLRAPRALSPRRLRAGPDPAKPAADLALAALLARAARRGRFEAVLAHNAEAALAAVAARPLAGAPVLYVAHTLFAEELGCYAPAGVAAPARAAGAALDAAVARAADGVLALSRRAARSLARHARGPVAWIPPGWEPGPAPGTEAVREACRCRGLAPGHYVLYAGNLDRYQDLRELDAAAGRLPGVPVVAAVHDAFGPAFAHLRVTRVRDAEETRRLVAGAALCVAPRRRAGGFPMKLLLYMEAARAVVARAGAAGTLEHGRSAWLLPEAAGASDLADAIGALLDDAERRERLGAAARAALASEHDPADVARRTLALLRRVARR